MGARMCGVAGCWNGGKPGRGFASMVLCAQPPARCLLSCACIPRAPLHTLSAQVPYVKRVIEEADGIQPHLVAPEAGYRRLLEEALGYLKDPTEKSVEEVSGEGGAANWHGGLLITEHQVTVHWPCSPPLLRDKRWHSSHSNSAAAAHPSPPLSRCLCCCAAWWTTSPTVTTSARCGATPRCAARL